MSIQEIAPWVVVGGVLVAPLIRDFFGHRDTKGSKTADRVEEHDRQFARMEERLDHVKQSVAEFKSEVKQDITSLATKESVEALRNSIDHLTSAIEKLDRKKASLSNFRAPRIPRIDESNPPVLK